MEEFYDFGLDENFVILLFMKNLDKCEKHGMQDGVFLMDVRIDKQPLDKLFLDIIQGRGFDGANLEYKLEHHELIRHDEQHKILRLLIRLQILSVSVNIWRNQGGYLIRRRGNLIQYLGNEISPAMMLRRDLEGQQCNKVFLLNVFEHLHNLFLVLFARLAHICLEQLGVKVTQHLIYHWPCVLILDDSEHQRPQHHVLEKHVQHHRALSQEQS